MSYFFCRLNPPRPTFMQDITPAEMKLMQEHSAYWRTFTEKGIAVVFGPVADPKGAWGALILETDSETSARAMTENDPTIKANAGFRFDVHVMPSAVVRERAAPAGVQA